jgi:hypothetical protein
MGRFVRLAVCITAGLWAGIANAGVTLPLISPAPVPINFGNQPLGTTSPSHTETYTVSGGSPGTRFLINSITASGDFAVVPGGTCLIGFANAVPSPGACTVFVSFTPTAVGSRSGSLTINCNTVVPVGGGSFTCTNNGLSSTTFSVPLLGGAFSITGVPALSSIALTLLSGALLLGALLTLKRRRA